MNLPREWFLMLSMILKSRENMDKEELKQLIKEKTIAIESAAEEGRPYPELMKIYKELKELQYQLSLSEISIEEPGDDGS